MDNIISEKSYRELVELRRELKKDIGNFSGEHLAYILGKLIMKLNRKDLRKLHVIINESLAYRDNTFSEKTL